MYTVMISDDGMFSAEYVQPPALSIPLGISGSSVEVRRNEDLTFSAMIDGQWVMITAETTVTAANGNVYAATLSPEGVPIGVMHVAEMQEVMLGELGGTVTVKKAEDMTYWIGEMAVMDGTEYTAANGNVYVLMMDAEGMWSAMYQKVMVMVDLGTQGSITLVRAEDMSWWLGSEGVGVGSEVMSDNGNTYTLWYTDGVWTARFEPESMMIEGTGLVAMTREGDDMYDVNGSTLPASGTGDVTVGGAMYHVWMQDGMLMGARFDDKQKDGRFNLGNHADGIGNPVLSVQDEAGLLMAMGYDTDEVKKTAANELQTHLKVRGEYFSIGQLLSTGQANRVGDNQSTIVSSALGELRKLRQTAVVTLDVFPDAEDAASLTSALDNLWSDAQAEVTKIFGDKVTLGNAENDEEILDDFDELIGALEDSSSFAYATQSGGGVFKDAKLSADAAASAFAAEKKEATATFGAVGNTRFGAFWRKQRDNAISKLEDPVAKDLGAFAYGTTGTLKTQRTRYVRQGTGSAIYQGETNAVDGKGNFFSGDIEIQVRFAAEKVNAVITNLTGDSGAWEYLYANTDVQEIILPDTTLSNSASWNSGTSKSGATVTYATRAGIPRPVTANYTFKGQLLGRDEGDQGNEAAGVWSLGDFATGGKNYLAGGFGAMRGEDVPDLRPEPDPDSDVQEKILPYGDILGAPADAANPTTGEDRFHGTDMADTRGQTIAGGMLTVIGQQFNREGAAIEDDESTTAANEAKYRTHKIDLAAALDNSAPAWANGKKHVDIAKEEIAKQLRILESDIGLTATVKEAAWIAVQDAILGRIFGFNGRDGDPVQTGGATTALTDAEKVTARAALPDQLGRTYSLSRNRDFVEAVEDVLEALASHANMQAALDVKGIFYREAGTFDFNTPATPNDDTDDTTQVVLNNKNGKGDGNVNLVARVESRVQYLVGSTDFTRFGAWRRQTSRNAKEGYENRTGSDSGDGPASLAFSTLAKTTYITPTGGGLDPRFPAGARMTYEGETIGVIGTVFFSGDIDVEVLWNTGTLGGMVNMSISEIENVADGARLYLDTNTTANDATDATNALQEVVSININNVDVSTTLGLSLDSDSTDPFTIVVNALAPGAVTENAPTLHTGLSSTSGDANVMGQFVGQGLSGPLAVLGTWEMANGTSGSTAIGARVANADATQVGVTGINHTTGVFTPVRIHAGFGAEAP